MTYDHWKTTNPREREEHDPEDHPSELDLAYQRIDELTHAIRKIIACSLDRQTSDLKFRIYAVDTARKALSLWIDTARKALSLWGGEKP